MKTSPIKTLIAASALAATTAAMTLPTPASAFGVFVGPRGGVAVGLGRPGFGYRGGYGYGRGFRGYYGGRGFYRGGGFYRPGFRRF